MILHDAIRLDGDVDAVLQRSATGGSARAVATLVYVAPDAEARLDAVRAMLADALEFPGYDQAGNVRVQAVQEADWLLLVSLWASYNRYLAHILAQLPEDKLETVCRIGRGEPVTLRFLAEDYLAHLLHHLRQIGLA